MVWMPCRDFNEAARGARRLRRPPIGIIGRRDRILREGVEDVGEEQFLVLLLVVQADLEDAQHLGQLRLVRVRHELLDRFVDMRAECGDPRHVRPRDQAALRAAHGADRRRRNRN